MRRLTLLAALLAAPADGVKKPFDTVLPLARMLAKKKLVGVKP